MKKQMYFLALFFLLFGKLVHSQKLFTTYKNLYAGVDYDINITYDDKEGFTLYIDAYSLDKVHKKGGIIIKEKQHFQFLMAINNAKAKYTEWKNTAKKNNVSTLSKTMKFSCPAFAYFMIGDGDDRNFDLTVTLSFDFLISDNKGDLDYLLAIKTGEIQSSRNKSMKADGFAIMFYSTDEIDNFTSKISNQKIIEFKTKPIQEDLFYD